MLHALLPAPLAVVDQIYHELFLKVYPMIGVKQKSFSERNIIVSDDVYFFKKCIYIKNLMKAMF